MITIERNDYSGLMPKTHHLYAEASEMVRVIYNEFQRIEDVENYTITLDSKCKVITRRDSKHRPYDVSIYFRKGSGHSLGRSLDWLFNKPKSPAYPISRRMASYLHKNCRFGGIYDLLRHLPFIEEVLQANIKNHTIVASVAVTASPIVVAPAPIATAATWSPSDVTMYDVYKCLRNYLSTTGAYEPLFINGEAILASSLVMMQEDGDPTLAARFEAERCPQLVAPAPASTKKAIKYDRAAIAGKAHYYAKASSIGTYHKRFGRGMKDAWTEAKKANGLAVSISKTVLLDVPKPVKIPAPITYSNGLFDHDSVSYYPSMYTLYTESKYFNSTRNHALRY